MRKFNKFFYAALAAGVLLATAILGGCSPKMISGTKIEDSPDTREVLKVVERYRKAMETKDVKTIIELTSKDYFEKNGNNNSRDNYDYEGLVKFLMSDDFTKVSKIKLVVLYKDVKFNDKKDRAEVIIHYILNFRKPPETMKQTVKKEGENAVVEDNFDEERWYSKSDDNLLVLVKPEKSSGWLIERGL